MKKALKVVLFVSWLLIMICLIFRKQIIGYMEDLTRVCYKPVIYLYPEVETEVTVKLDFAGDFICTYPKYKEQWKVIAHPDGTLYDTESCQEYSYLFWEGRYNYDFDLSKGYVVAGGDTAEFLQKTLAAMGLTPREYNEFIVYWLPIMQDNPYNLITFQEKEYTDYAPLYISPEPESLLRVFMVYKPLKEPIESEAPEIKTFKREGFTVVEWGGSGI